MAVVDRPRHVIVWYRGAPYELDLVRCRRALVMRQVEGELDNMNSLARAVGVSRSTASRFFSGRSTSLAVTLGMLRSSRRRAAGTVGDGRGHDRHERRREW